MSLVQRTVYFREEDISAWNAIDNKAEFLHTVLNDVKEAEVSEEKPHKKWETDQDIIDDVLEVFPGAIVEKPEFMCCTSKRTRCNHWQWDLDKALWINSISRREVAE